MKNFSIGSIAESILSKEAKDLKEGKAVVNHITKTVVRPDPKALDVRKVKLDEEEREKILEEAFGAKIRTNTPKPKKQEVDVNALLTEFNQLVIRAKELITEMTSCGMLGVNMAGPGKKNTSKGIYDKKNKKILSKLRK